MAGNGKVRMNAYEHIQARMTKNDEILRRVAELTAPAVEAVELSVERVLQEMMRLAYYDMTAIINSKDNQLRAGAEVSKVD